MNARQEGSKAGFLSVSLNSLTFHPAKTAVNLV